MSEGSSELGNSVCQELKTIFKRTSFNRFKLWDMATEVTAVVGGVSDLAHGRRRDYLGNGFTVEIWERRESGNTKFRVKCALAMGLGYNYLHAFVNMWSGYYNYAGF